MKEGRKASAVQIRSARKARAYFHRPHPRKEAKPYQVRDARGLSGRPSELRRGKHPDSQGLHRPRRILGRRRRARRSSESASAISSAFTPTTPPASSRPFRQRWTSYVALNAETAQKPYSGNLMFRVDPALARRRGARAAKAARHEPRRSGARGSSPLLPPTPSSDAPVAGVASFRTRLKDGGPSQRNALSWEDREIVRLASGAIQIRRDGAVQPVVVKDGAAADRRGRSASTRTARTRGRSAGTLSTPW